ncbi:MAG TPA: carbohydrate binding family 9 domain-containing protein, partial [Gammaproteobacteria bacterium]
MVGALLGHTVSAQGNIAAGGQLKTTEVVYVETAPVLDGRLDDGVWSQAFVIDDLHQINPTEYAEPSVQTRIYLVYTQDALYVGAELLDADAANIGAQVLRQGEGIFGDDVFGVILDPFNDRRSGFRFDVNPNGVRSELLFQNTSQQNADWQGIWRAAASQNEEGWIAEMEIPFKTLSFDPANDTWGINFMRWLPRQNEWLGWVSRNNTMNPGISGVATGFENMEQGVGLDVVPSISLRKSKDYSLSASDTDNEPSLDLFYKLTPGLNASLTINTDFSATEVDDRQVDLSRFSLFFPEKRDFFLADADIFEFGRLGSIGTFGNGPTFARP